MQICQIEGFDRRGKENPNPDIVKRKIRAEHGTPMLSLPKAFLKAGLTLNQEVVIEKRGEKNPLNWEIVIKPAKKSLDQANNSGSNR